MIKHYLSCAMFALFVLLMINLTAFAEEISNFTVANRMAQVFRPGTYRGLTPEGNQCTIKVTGREPDQGYWATTQLYTITASIGGVSDHLARFKLYDFGGGANISLSIKRFKESKDHLAVTFEDQASDWSGPETVRFYADITMVGKKVKVVKLSVKELVAFGVFKSLKKPVHCTLDYRP